VEIDRIGAEWLKLGARLAVITDGPKGAYLFEPGAAPIHRPGRAVRVADTVGAGDAFTAGLLGALARRGLHTPERLERSLNGLLPDVLDEAILISALTCERTGADPPTAAPRSDLPADAPLTPADLTFP
jgi:fructokinase